MDLGLLISWMKVTMVLRRYRDVGLETYVGELRVNYGRQLRCGNANPITSTTTTRQLCKDKECRSKDAQRSLGTKNLTYRKYHAWMKAG
jgi:hypothetical protein